MSNYPTYSMDLEEFTDIASKEYIKAREKRKALKMQETEDRFKVRKKLRLFYLNLQGILKSAGCFAKQGNINFDQSEQEAAEEIWKRINEGFDDMQRLIEKYQAKDRGKLRCQ